MMNPIPHSSDDRIELIWPGKDQSVRMADIASMTKLMPCREKSINWDTTGHTVIEGDNLDALKNLLATHTGRIKAIYIDPPFNRGDDTVITDDLTDRRAPNGTAARHRQWLSMMYPRLALARRLLRDDGVIFISIDDYEITHLRCLMDEIFGENHFISQAVWQRARTESEGLVANIHEYLLCYARNRPCAQQTGSWDLENKEATRILEYYTQLQKDLENRHDEIETAMTQWFTNLDDDATCSVYREFHHSDDGGLFCRIPDNNESYILSGINFHLPRDGKVYLSSLQNMPFASVFIYMLESEEMRNAASEIGEMIGPDWFPYPKSVRILTELFRRVTGPEDIVMDFFAGSGSTAIAILSLNADTRSNRRYILVQLPEATGSTLFPCVTDVIRERISRMEKRIGCPTLDTGFQYLKVHAGRPEDFGSNRDIGLTNPTKGALNRSNSDPSRQRVAVLFHGMAPRSIKYTWDSINKNLILALRESNFDVDIFMHTWLIKDSMLSSSNGRHDRPNEDLSLVNNDDYKIIPCKKAIAEYQEDIALPANAGTHRSLMKNEHEINSAFLKRFMHVMRIYITLDKVTEMMLDEEIIYDAVVILRPDLYLPRKLDINEVTDVIDNKDIYYNTETDWTPRREGSQTETDMNTGSPHYGIGDSFILTSMDLAKVYGKRFSHIKSLATQNKLIDAWWAGFNQGYDPFAETWLYSEMYLGYLLDHSKWRDSSMIYMKVRADKQLSWHKNMVLNRMSQKELTEYNEWVLKHGILNG